MTKRVLLVEAEAIEECELGVHTVSKHDMSEFVCQDCGKTSLVGKHVQ